MTNEKERLQAEVDRSEQILILETQMRVTQKELLAAQVKLNNENNPAQRFVLRQLIDTMLDVNSTRAKLIAEYEKSVLAKIG